VGKKDRGRKEGSVRAIREVGGINVYARTQDRRAEKYILFLFYFYFSVRKCRGEKEMEVSKLYKHGGSVVAVVPASLRKELGWEHGDCVVIQKVEGKNTLTMKRIAKVTFVGGEIKDEEE